MYLHLFYSLYVCVSMMMIPEDGTWGGDGDGDCELMVNGEQMVNRWSRQTITTFHVTALHLFFYISL